ncbi:LuxR C-terminal-related transcriptional regulator [Streptomyces sp. NPDC005805]|uniref:helix-turn-helix transcriptional regulator n=1 Tax=Streptomyces sp. NPDC005805 TaxID=3157068 RepID=UPI0033FCA8C1
MTDTLTESPAQLIGRAAQVTQIRDAVEDALSTGNGAVLLVLGARGSGRTSTVREALRPVERRGVPVRWDGGAPRPGRPGRGGEVHVLDDAHLFDEARLPSLSALLEGVRLHGGCAVVTGDDGIRSAATDQVHRLVTVPPLYLDALREGETELLVQRLVPAGPARRPVTGAVLSWCDGLPLAVEEVVAFLLREYRQGVDVARYLTLPPLPPATAARIGESLDALGGAARRIVEVAALLGESFDARAVPVVSRDPSTDVHTALQRAMAVGLVRPDRSSGPTRYRFTGRLTAATTRAEALARHPPRTASAVADLLHEQARESFASGELGLCRSLLTQAWTVLAEHPEQRAAVRPLLLEALSHAGDLTAARHLDLLAGESGAAREERPQESRSASRLSRLASRPPVPAHRDPREGSTVPRRTWIPDADVVCGVLSAADAALAHGSTRRATALARRAVTDCADLASPALLCDALDVLGNARLTCDPSGAGRAFARMERVAAVHRLRPWTLRAQVGLATVDFLRAGLPEPVAAAGHAARAAGAIGLGVRCSLQQGLAGLLDGDLRGARRTLGAARVLADRLGAELLSEQAADLLRVVDHLAPGQDGAVPPAHDAPGSVRLRLLLSHRLTDLAECLDAEVAAGGYGPPAPSPAAFPWQGVQVLVATLAGGPPHAAPLPAGFADRALTHCARAVDAGRRGDPAAAERSLRQADRLTRHAAWLRDLGRLCIAGDALAQGWGTPVAWLQEGLRRFTSAGQEGLASAARTALRAAGAPVPRRGRGDSEVPPALARLGVTSREMDVLRLVGSGLGNRDIAERLLISPRTVETHVASLFAKTRSSDRRALGALLRELATTVPAR